jgi:hypothetical protein
MEINNMDLEYDMDYILNDYISNLYIKFKYYDKNIKREIFKCLLTTKTNEPINIFSLYSLFVMDTVDDEFKKDIFFDQESGFVKKKSYHKEGNEFMSNAEINSVLEELEIKPKKETICRHIITRVRVLSIINIWNHTIDCETLIFKGKETEKYKEEFKKYVFDNPKHLRYNRLLKAALDNGKIFEHPDPLPKNFKEFQQFLKNPLVYVMLEPYNHIKKENDIVTGYIINNEVIISKITE